MKAPRLTKNSDGHFDLKFENGVLGPWCEDGTQAAQHAMTRLLIHKGEPSLNGVLTGRTGQGTKWFETIWAMDKPKSEKILEVKSRILGTPGVKSIIRFQWEQTGHTVEMDIEVQTDWGVETLSQTIEPL